MSDTASIPETASAPRISVVIPTYERAERVARLVALLEQQTLPPDAFEVIVVDDGSKVDPRSRLEAIRRRFHLVLERQTNQGAAAARHRGIELARAPIVLCLDDDMIPSPELLAEHLAVHDATPRAVVVGCVRSGQAVRDLPLFERFHAYSLDKMAASIRATGRVPRGTEIYSGNLSFRCADYLAVGGFDKSLPRSEDLELGFRLEKAGAAMRYADAASTIHDTDHTDEERWLRTAFTYGVTEQRIGRKHAASPEAGPFRYFALLRALPMPAFALSIVAPGVGHLGARAVTKIAAGLDALGLERPAISAMTLAYGMEYYRGVRTEAGSAAVCWRDLQTFRAHRRATQGGVGAASSPRRRRPRTAAGRLRARLRRQRLLVARFAASVRADHATLQRGDAKYDTRGRKPSSLRRDLVERIGFQILTGVRLMRLLRDSGSPTGAKVAARLLRHLYGADIHWTAELADGVSIVHGTGLAIVHSARIGKGAILSQNVTIGDGTDPKTRAVGQPVIEEDVHIGPGAVVIGPVTVGARSRIGPNVVLRESIPPDTVVEIAPPILRPRARRPVAPPAEPPVAAPPPAAGPDAILAAPKPDAVPATPKPDAVSATPKPESAARAPS